MTDRESDRELLEWAAKANGCWDDGYRPVFRDGEGWICIRPPREDFPFQCVWAPLTDDGDALRLAVRLGLAVIPYPIYAHPKHSVIAKVYKDSAEVYRDEEKRIEQIEVYGDDPAAATRLAIVRAAAAIGKESK